MTHPAKDIRPAQRRPREREASMVAMPARETAPEPAENAAPQGTGALPENAVAVQGLDKVYRAGGERPVHALDNVDLAIPRGSLFGLLGPNGAGKSTLINILAGLVLKTSGRATVWGIDLDRDPRGVRAAIGVVPQELNIDAFFTPRQLLELQAGMYGVPKAERRTTEILDRLGLADKSEAYARSLSGGMRRRLMVAKALVHTPPVLVLDEPTAGVDVELRQQLWAYVRELHARGSTILLTTHYLEEAEELCDRIAIIDHGRVIACDTTSGLLARIDTKVLRISLARPLAEVPAQLARWHARRVAPQVLEIAYRPSEGPVGAILADLTAAGLTIADIAVQESDLEDVFLALTRRQGPGADSGPAFDKEAPG
jgi:ABC-2 type transport system ATP-binding protein